MLVCTTGWALALVGTKKPGASLSVAASEGSGPLIKGSGGGDGTREVGDGVCDADGRLEPIGVGVAMGEDGEEAEEVAGADSEGEAVEDSAGVEDDGETAEETTVETAEETAGVEDGKGTVDSWGDEVIAGAGEEVEGAGSSDEVERGAGEEEAGMDSGVDIYSGIDVDSGVDVDSDADEVSTGSSDSIDEVSAMLVGATASGVTVEKRVKENPASSVGASAADVVLVLEMS
ncbi:hypothetical protein COCC4DRAFT_64995 [Bipolaris maydis ATCC 48331]|uniref:Uncharacterized protein n=2 Tax=Cochliobolus heterostrophus TaxID=5016 RepID=M2UNS3_COCH5|nr:uncharacterized protein COCC4DRAFT_64995 [Bipolaris maydis ATCC 48331]EMD95241.1 hypothetical protein COCHEDRAFT_23123 [Bipolaris maydis C5]ENI00868.1 hypothetical protein COCC4DRAFT_64995 [Bipolaris maydis ATCC 48331]